MGGELDALACPVLAGVVGGEAVVGAVGPRLLGVAVVEASPPFGTTAS